MIGFYFSEEYGVKERNDIPTVMHQTDFFLIGLQV